MACDPDSVTEVESDNHMDDREFLFRLKTYIENSEKELDTFSGSHRNVEQMLAANLIPLVYFEVIKRIKDLGTAQ